MTLKLLNWLWLNICRWHIARKPAARYKKNENRLTRFRDTVLQLDTHTHTHTQLHSSQTLKPLFLYRGLNKQRRDHKLQCISDVWLTNYYQILYLKEHQSEKKGIHYLNLMKKKNQAQASWLPWPLKKMGVSFLEEQLKSHL